jgi:hypothetical protein
VREDGANSMPAATPLPRGPSVLSLFGIEDLLTGPGCPVCRYTTEASDRYLRWFALEGHSQPELITTLCASLGMCARHTRGLMSQPGAATRLTPVYRYVLTGVRDRLAGRTLSQVACPACRHDGAAAGRAMDTLVDGLADPAALHLCQHLGGVCLPHLQAAAKHAARRIVDSLAGTLRDTLATRPAGYEWLGGTDYDAETRVALRPRTLAALLAPGLCAACMAAAEAERESLARATEPGVDGADEERPLCAGHLADALAMSRSGQRHVLLVWQSSMLPGEPQWRARAISARRLARWLRPTALRSSSDDCPVCRESCDAALRALASAGRAARTPSAAAQEHRGLCVRHQVILRSTDQQAGRALSNASVAAADELIAELAEAFELSTWAGRRDGVEAPESTAWRRAAAFLNGGVFAGLQT